MKFIELKEKYILKPIYGCPGRYILKLDTFISMKELVDEPENIKEYRLKTAEDTICIYAFEDGGFISYKKQDNSYIHTLNTIEGFIKKIKKLGIKL